MTGEKQTDSLNRLREIVLHNFWLKVISLLMAFTLWYYVTGGPRREETISVPLDLHRYIPEGWTLAEPYDEEVEIRLRGRDEEIVQLLDPDNVQSSVSINVDPGQIRPQREVQRLQLDASNVSVPFGIEVLQVVQDSISLRLDHQITRSIPISPRLSGSPDECYQLLGYRSVNPVSVNVTGPESVVSQLSEVYADANADGRGPGGESVRGTLERNPLLAYSVLSAEITLRIEELETDRAITLDSTNFIYGDSSTPVQFEIDPRNLVLTIHGPCSAVRSFRQEEIRLVINPDSVPDNGSRIEVTFEQTMVVMPGYDVFGGMEYFRTQLSPGTFWVIVRRPDEGGGPQ